MRASVVVPTRNRASYLEVALRSIVPQADAVGAEVLVVDDAGEDGSEEVARRCGATYRRQPRPLGLNAGRNAGIDRTTGELLCFVDDDVEARPGWLAALLGAAAERPDVDVFTGPILARFEGRPLRFCGREAPPITHTDLGDEPVEVSRAWGANLAVRRSAFDRVGAFDADHATGAGDEEEWERRLVRAGGRMLYVPAAAVDHRRAEGDASIAALARAARVRGRTARRFDVASGRAPALGYELRVLIGCLAHGPRFRCANGPILSAHALGRLEEALRPPPAPHAEDFLSGRSGTVGGRRRTVRAALDAVLDRAWRRGPVRGERRRVLVLGIERPGNRMPEVRAELERSGHDVAIDTRPPGERGKFENLNAMLAAHDLDAVDWLLVVDDDVVLPRGFLDRFLALAERADLRLAQPAHRLASHAAWPVTRRRPASLVRETRFVEIGPVTAFHRATFDALLPFPGLRMGWGLDVHWAAVAQEHGWRIGIVDATPILHTTPAAGTYPREQAVAEARAFLSTRPYVPRDEASRTLRTHR